MPALYRPYGEVTEKCVLVFLSCSLVSYTELTNCEFGAGRIYRKLLKTEFRKTAFDLASICYRKVPWVKIGKILLEKLR
jgi:hypothetical protein